MFDAMAIKEQIVFDEHSKQLVGYVDFGPNHQGGANQKVMVSELYQSTIHWSLSEQEK